MTNHKKVDYSLYLPSTAYRYVILKKFGYASGTHILVDSFAVQKLI